jgi:hypothetical protein
MAIAGDPENQSFPNPAAEALRVTPVSSDRPGSSARGKTASAATQNPARTRTTTRSACFSA